MFYAARESDDLSEVFLEKCYICECKINTGVEREHHIPKSAALRIPLEAGADLNAKWNLFLACERCNGIKGSNYYSPSNDCVCGHGYIGIIDCTNCDPAQYIELKYIQSLATVGNILVSDKNDAFCNEHTAKLLRAVYSSNKRIPDQEFRRLMKSISSSIAETTTLTNQLSDWFAYGGIHVDKKHLMTLILWKVSPDAPFSAFTRTYLEELSNEFATTPFGEALREILSDTSLNPITPINCNIT